MNKNTALRTKLGLAVRGRRKKLGLSQGHLAEKASLHRTYVADIERGARNPSLRVLASLATALETSISTLFASEPHAFTVPTNGSKHAETVDILLVEDNPQDVRLVLRAFKKAHLTNNIHVINDGAEALAFLSANGHRWEGRPAVILLDLGLPKVSGLEVLRRIRADERTNTIPVVVMTGSEDERDVAECRRLGVEAYVVKPVDFQRLSLVTPKLDLSWMLLKINGRS